MVKVIMVEPNITREENEIRFKKVEDVLKKIALENEYEKNCPCNTRTEKINDYFLNEDKTVAIRNKRHDSKTNKVRKVIATNLCTGEVSEYYSPRKIIHG